MQNYTYEIFLTIISLLLKVLACSATIYKPLFGAVAKWKRWGLQNLDARVRFSSAPPKRKTNINFKLHARVAELVYAGDLKSPARKGLRVRFPLRAP